MGETLTRRGFMKAAGAVTAAGALSSLLACSSNLETDEEAVQEDAAVDTAEALNEGEEHFATCGWSCSFCQYRIFTRDGNICHMLPKEDYDYRTCLKGRSRIQRTYSDARVQYPMKRVEGTPRGGGEWERISWDQAVEEISAKWNQVAEEFGPTANSYYQGGGGFQHVPGAVQFMAMSKLFPFAVRLFENIVRIQIAIRLLCLFQQSDCLVQMGADFRTVPVHQAERCRFHPFCKITVLKLAPSELTFLKSRRNSEIHHSMTFLRPRLRIIEHPPLVRNDTLHCIENPAVPKRVRYPHTVYR